MIAELIMGLMMIFGIICFAILSIASLLIAIGLYKEKKTAEAIVFTGGFIFATLFTAFAIAIVLGW